MKKVRKYHFLRVFDDFYAKIKPFFYFWIRIQPLREYGLNTDPDPKPWLVPCGNDWSFNTEQIWILLSLLQNIKSGYKKTYLEFCFRIWIPSLNCRMFS